MPPHQTCVTQLLQIYHSREPAAIESVELPTGDQIKYLCDIGLGPIAFQIYGDEFRKSDSKSFSVLQSADLTTRVIYGQLERATLELTGKLQGVGVTPIVLKGISTSYEFYEPSYLRVMCDIDILIKDSEVELVMAMVADLGYEITDQQWREYRELGHHHLPDARHPETGVTIEVHTGLFASAELYAGEYVFQPDIILQQSIEFDYSGTYAVRFRPEFQFIYTVSKWSVDIDWAVNLKNINDMIHILRKYDSKFDWSRLSEWFAASPHLVPITAALMHYLEQANLVTASHQLHDALARTDHKLGPKKLKMLAWLLHTYPFNARDKNNHNYQRWFAHAFWMYLTKPHHRNLGISREIMRQFYTNLVHGKYNPIRRLLSGLKALAYRIRQN